MGKFLEFLKKFGITGKQANRLAGEAKITKVKLPGVAGKILGKSERAPLLLLNQKMMFDPNLLRFSTGTVGLDGRYYHLLREYELVNAEIARTAKYLFENNVKMNKTQRINWESAIDKWKRTNKELSTITTKFKKQKINPEDAFKNYEKKITEGRHQDDVPLPSTVGDLQYEMDFLRRSAQELSTSSREELRRLGMLDESGEVNFGEYLRRQLHDATGRTTRSLSESYHRATVRPFLIKQHEAGKIKLSDEHYNQLKNAADLNSGGSNRLKVVDPVSVFKYHYGEKAFDKIPSGLNDMNVYTKDGTQELVKLFEDAGITVKNKASAGDASKYLSKDYIYKEIERIDDAMTNIKYGDDPFWNRMTDAEKQHTLSDLERQSLAYQEVLSIADLPREVKLRSLIEEGEKVKWRNQTNLKEFDLTILKTGNPTDEHIDFLYEMLFRPKKFDPTSNTHIAMREEILENLPDVYTKADLENVGNIEGLYYDHVHAGDIKTNQGQGSISQKVPGSVKIETITPKTPPKKKPELTILSKEDMEYQTALKKGMGDQFKKELKLRGIDDKAMDFIFKDVKAGQTFEESYATILKNAKEWDKQKKTRVYKDEKGETKGIAMGWTESELRQLDEAMKKGMAESDAMKAAGLDPSNYDDFKKWEEMKKAKKTEPTVISEGDKGYDEITEKLGITAKPGYPITESGKADLKVVKTTKKDRLATAKELEEYESILDPTGDAYIVQEGMTVGELDKMVADHKAYVNDMHQKYKRGELNKYVKKDRPNIRIMKNYDKELLDSELALEGYNLQEIEIMQRAREVMKKEKQNPDDALAWVRGEMADDAGIEFEEFMTEFDWGDFPGGNASGGLPRSRVGLHRGSLRHQKEHDYKAYEKKGNFMKHLMLSGDRAMMSSPENVINRLVNPKMGYNQKRDDFETWQKERFMYGEHKPLNVFEDLFADLKERYKKIRGKKADGGRVGYAMGSQGELGSMLVRLRNVVEGSGMYANFSPQNRKSLQISLTSQINALLGN